MCICPVCGGRRLIHCIAKNEHNKDGYMIASDPCDEMQCRDCDYREIIPLVTPQEVR